MRFMIMHRTTPHWEAGALPGPELIARVGGMIADLADAGTLRAAEGLRPSSEGVRLRFSGGTRTTTRGPLPGENELIAGFAIVRIETIEDAVEWATRLAAALGAAEIDVRPVTEPWDLGMAPRPAGLATRRFMLMHKADAASEAGLRPTAAQLAELRRLLDDASRAGVLLAAEALEPSAKGARLRFARGKHSVLDGPFAESKELIAGYVVVEAPSLRDAMPWAARYGETVGCPELDLRTLTESAPA